MSFPNWLATGSSPGRRPRSSRSGASSGLFSVASRRARAIALVVLVPVLALSVLSSVGSATTLQHAKTPAHAQYEPMSYFQAQVAKYESLSSMGSAPSTAPPHKSGVNIWTISCGQESAGCSGPSAATVQAGALLGWHVKVCDGNFGIADAYDTCIRQAIAAGAQGVITIGISCNQAHASMLELKAKHIPLVGVGGFDCSNHFGYVSPNKVFTSDFEYSPVAPNSALLNEANGRAVADWLVVHFGGHVSAIDTVFSLIPALYANVGFTSELAKCQGCHIVDTIDYTPPDTSNGNLKNEFAAALAKYPTANAAFNFTDAIVDQDNFIQSIDSVGREHSMCLVSTQDDAGAVNDEDIASGNAQCADAGLENSWQGFGVVDEMLRALDGQPPVLEGNGPLLIVKGHNLGTVGQPWAYPYNVIAAYKKAWGI
ncbi:MAG TPA: hypothetical protein VMD59_13660 [Acidimicrobiales bacterium]|nr:hypothetical protein [Acidimicrobiales bacterium]